MASAEARIAVEGAACQLRLSAVHHCTRYSHSEPIKPGAAPSLLLHKGTECEAIEGRKGRGAPEL